MQSMTSQHTHLLQRSREAMPILTVTRSAPSKGAEVGPSMVQIPAAEMFPKAPIYVALGIKQDHR
jgi:hypothetical protein